MANDNQNQVFEDNIEVVDGDKAKRIRKAKPKTSESSSTAS